VKPAIHRKVNRQRMDAVSKLLRGTSARTPADQAQPPTFSPMRGDSRRFKPGLSPRHDRCDGYDRRAQPAVAANGMRRFLCGSEPAIRVIGVWTIWSCRRRIIGRVRCAGSSGPDNGTRRDTRCDTAPAIAATVAAIITADIHVAVPLVEGAVAASDIGAVASGEIRPVASGEVASASTGPVAATAPASAAASASKPAAAATASKAAATAAPTAAAKTAATAASTPTTAPAHKQDRRIGLFCRRRRDVGRKAAAPCGRIRGCIGSQ
jgi:hypothetical protein